MQEVAVVLCCSDEQNEDCREALFHQRNGYVGLCEIRLAPSEPSCPGRTPTSGANSRSTVVGFDSRIGATGGWRTAWCLVPLTAASSCAQGVEAWLRVSGQTKQRFWDAAKHVSGIGLTQLPRTPSMLQLGDGSSSSSNGRNAAVRLRAFKPGNINPGKRQNASVRGSIRVELRWIPAALGKQSRANGNQ